MPILVNAHTYLSELVAADKAALVEHLKEKEIYDHTLRIPYPYTEADADKFLAFLAEKEKEQGHTLNWAIRDGRDALIGCCSLEDFTPGQSHRAEVGYWLAKPYWGRGIMTAVVRALCEHARTELGLRKITAHVFAFNRGSARVLEKCGFEQEGYLKKHLVKDGRLVDVRLYGLIQG